MENLIPLDQLVVKKIYEHPILFDKRFKKVQNRSILVEEAFQKIQEELLLERGVDLGVDTLTKTFNSHLRKSKAAVQEDDDAVTNNPDNVIIPLIKHRKGLASELPLEMQQPPKKKKRCAPRSRRSSTKCVVPPLDKFAVDHKASLKKMESTFASMSQTFQETQKAIQKANQTPTSYTYNMILRKVSSIDKTKYSQIIKRVCLALAELQSESCNSSGK